MARDPAPHPSKLSMISATRYGAARAIDPSPPMYMPGAVKAHVLSIILKYLNG